jgi:hypothetical protein
MLYLRHTSVPPVAQSVEHLPFKQRVVGSIPTGRTCKKQHLRAVFYYKSESELESRNLSITANQKRVRPLR